MNGLRIETWEGANLQFKEQLKPETAFIFRRGLAKTDLVKDTINIGINNKIMIGSKPSAASATKSVPSLSSILSDLIHHSKGQSLQQTLDVECADQFQAIR